MSVIVEPRAARRARRPEARAPAHPLRDAALGLDWNKKYMKSSQGRRRHDGQLPPARQPGHLRRARAHGAGLLHARAADRRPGQLRLRRRRSAGRRALHRGAGSSKVAQFLLDDLDKETVDFKPNYDDRLEEPSVLPAKFPNLLVNGAGGIAVGMATNIPPHNLGEVIDACDRRCSTTPRSRIDDLCQIIHGPDFPTGGLILGRAGTLAAYHKGRGSIIMRAKVEVEDGAQGSRGSDRHGHPLPGQQEDADREDRRPGAREEDRGHLRHLGREQPRGHAHRHRAEARCHRRRRAQPALALLRSADDVRRQHAGDQRRPARAAQPQGHDPGLHRLPPGGGDAAHAPSAHQGARSRPRPRRSRHRRRQHRRGDQADPRCARSPAEAKDQLMARDWPAKRHGAADRAHRRPAPQARGGRHLQALRGAGQGDPRAETLAPHRARPRRDRRRAQEDRRGDQGLPRDPLVAQPHRRHRQERARRASRPSSRPRARPRSSTSRARSRTRT